MGSYATGSASPTDIVAYTRPARLHSADSAGGTITGVGQVLKERKPSVRMVAVEPASSPPPADTYDVWTNPAIYI